MKLYSGPLSMFGAKAQIAVLEKGIGCEFVMVPYGLEQGYSPKHEEVLRINPKAQVPVLIDGKTVVYDSTQIFEYLEDRYPEPSLWPAVPELRVIARQLEHASDEVFFVHVIQLMRRSNSSPEIRKQARTNIANYYQRMEALVGPTGFLCGTSFGYADIAFFMAQLFASFLRAPMTDATPALRQWQSRAVERPAVRQVVLPMARFASANGMELPDFLTAIA